MTIKKSFCFLILPVLLLSGCMSDLTGTSYSREEARQTQQVQFGIVSEIKRVKIEGTQSGIGAAAGGAMGGIAAGSNIGGGSGSSIAAIAGGLAGGLLGNLTEEKLTRKQGLELTIKLDNGTMLSVVQQADPKMPFAVGDEVKVLGQGTKRRVVK
ncbi:Outer membrane lipoprotein pcp [invertebrate metagenome]|uniref:Outer membrane lipoprotein pcp n=1 Tax=invertebrate metagenome TaxID=1711999 RepID=A0A2H9T885_9ZZZZ